jgi:hypothetical protein
MKDAGDTVDISSLYAAVKLASLLEPMLPLPMLSENRYIQGEFCVTYSYCSSICSYATSDVNLCAVFP